MSDSKPELYYCICQKGLIVKEKLMDHLSLPNTHYVTPIHNSTTPAELKQAEDEKEQALRDSRQYIYRQTLLLICKIINKAMKTNDQLRKLEHDYEKIIKGAPHNEDFDKYVLAMNRIDKKAISKALKEYYQQFTIASSNIETSNNQ